MIRAVILSVSLAALAVPAAAQPAAKVAAANKAALREPSSTGFIHAVHTYPYTQGALYRLSAAPARVADLPLQPDHMITSVAAGYTLRRTVADTTIHRGTSPHTPHLLTHLAEPH